MTSCARQLQLDGIELEQQIVAERAHQRQPRRQRMVELVDQRAQDRKRRRLLAALLFRKQRRQRLQRARAARRLRARNVSQCGCGASTGSSIRLSTSPRGFSGRNVDVAALGNDLERRRDGGDVPARISPRKFVAGGKIDAALRVQLLAQRLQPAAVGHVEIVRVTAMPLGVE